MAGIDAEKMLKNLVYCPEQPQNRGGLALGAGIYHVFKLTVRGQTWYSQRKINYLVPID